MPEKNAYAFYRLGKGTTKNNKKQENIMKYWKDELYLKKKTFYIIIKKVRDIDIIIRPFHQLNPSPFI